MNSAAKASTGVVKSPTNEKSFWCKNQNLKTQKTITLFYAATWNIHISKKWKTSEAADGDPISPKPVQAQTTTSTLTPKTILKQKNQTKPKKIHLKTHTPYKKKKRQKESITFKAPYSPAS